MPTIYLNEDQSGGPCECLAYPNVHSCIAVTALLRDGNLVGGHFTSKSAITPVCKNMKTLMGTQGIQCLFLIGGYGFNRTLHNANGAAGHAIAVAEALGFQGRAYSYDAQDLISKGNGALIRVQDGTLTGLVKVSYEKWSKLESQNKGGKNLPNAPLGMSGKVTNWFTHDVELKKKSHWWNKEPHLEWHDIPLNLFTVYTIH